MGGDVMGARKAVWQAIVISNEALTETIYLMTLNVDGLAEQVDPGQFIHMSIPTLQTHILRRPFSVYDVDVEAHTIDILYQVVGSGTLDMTTWEPGYTTDMIAPIGRAWEIPEGTKHALLVGGGIGAAPLFLLYKQLLQKGIETDVVLGATTHAALVSHERYTNAGNSEPFCSTDDGSFGQAGFATPLAEEAIKKASDGGNPYDFIAACGPEPLMRGIAALASDNDIECFVSMEKRMACGVGACLSCIVETTKGRKRACVDGPIFNAQDIIW